MTISSTHNNTTTINKTTRTWTRTRSRPFASRAITATRCAFLLLVAAIAATSGTTGFADAATAPAAAATAAATATVSTSTCNDPNTTFEKKKKIVNMCQWAADAAAKKKMHRKRCNSKKKKIITATSTSTATATVLVKVKDECPCACAKFNGNDDTDTDTKTDIDTDTDIDNDENDGLPSSSLCPVAEGFNREMAYILSGQTCNNNNNNNGNGNIVCNYAYIKTGCTTETQACQPAETCSCTNDSKWLCIITDYEFINQESCSDVDAPRSTLRSPGYRDRALAASELKGGIPEDIGLECNPNADAEPESTIVD